MRGLSLAAVLLVLGGCKLPDRPVPAVLESTDEGAVSALRASLASALGQARVELGPEDLSTSSAVSVLPPKLNPLEGRSTAMPVQFDLVLEAGACLLVHRETGEVYPLEGTECRPA
ncbi:MAG: hypothetical protein AAF768_11395 [Pseudomonadota bacterium]